MESCLDIASIEMDYGVLHDQRCTTVVCRDNTMTFTFDIHLCPDDYAEDVYKKYRKYGMCRVELSAKRVQWKWY